VVEPATERLLLRSDSIWLNSLVQSGDVDYAFVYESVARQQGVNFLKLPDAVNLSSAEYAAFYGTVKVKLAFQRFASMAPVFTGGPVIYGITIPRNAPHPDQAQDFVTFVLGPEGQAILQQDYHPAIIPPVADQPGNMPSALRAFITPAGE
jgi:molybdate/tungstate transport system substrate-binding protein